jgi:hypothetical protein
MQRIGTAKKVNPCSAHNAQRERGSTTVKIKSHVNASILKVQTLLPGKK